MNVFSYRMCYLQDLWGECKILDEFSFSVCCLTIKNKQTIYVFDVLTLFMLLTTVTTNNTLGVNKLNDNEQVVKPM